MGGKFDSVTQLDNTTLSVNNTVAFVNGTTWVGLGTGIVGEVNRIRTDKCNNVYFGGKFHIAGDMETGPIAKWNPIMKKWSKITDAPVFWFPDPIVNDFRITSCNDNCVCDFWIVGKFTAQVPESDTFANNVIRWDSSKARWDTLGGATRAVTIGEVFSVYKKELQVNPSTEMVWIGGNFPGSFTKFHITTRKWGLSYHKDGIYENIKGTIYDMYFKVEQYYEMDKIYMVGEFTIEPNQCTNQCQFNIKSEEFVKIGQENTIPTAIFTSAWGNSTLYAGGNILNSSFLIKKIRLPTIAGTWLSLTPETFPAPGVVKTLDICDKFGCVSGAFSVGGSKGVLRYFNGTHYHFFANGIDGSVNSIISISNFTRMTISWLAITILIINLFIL